ncbi:hypothetical protein [Egicoccus halophilus]|uniref:Uncharacterized protein n=1 Tax=Egicoccus halophilus TaxID=1670830 RepID=A0A8J3EV72_9ACTN|nr:hypothetical protein [Egicoccus halophilus]GGI08592.1 hypothetical protein GCM10011354_29850 [Egicoccus halophilus]
MALLRLRLLCCLLLAVVTAACGLLSDSVTFQAPEPGDPAATPQATSTPTDEAAPAPTTAPQQPRTDGTDDEAGPVLPPAPEMPPPYELHPDETHPNAKALGAEVAQTLTTYGPDETFEDVTGRLADGATRERLAEEAAGLYHPDAWSRGEVVYPQFGGLTADRASIMVVLRQTIGEPGADEARTEVRTIDVRLRLREDVWLLEGIASDGGVPVPRPDDLPEEAVAVLDDERIELPDSSRWDIHRGATEPELLELLTRLADEVGDVGVVVLETGHPYHVFGTDRMSDHLRGRAVDIHRLGGELVIEGHTSLESETRRVVEWLYDEPSRPIIGSPWALDGYGGRSFTDAVHLDHVHAAVRPRRD